MKKLWKRIVAVTMAVMMVVTCMPVDVAEAAEDLDVTEYESEIEKLKKEITKEPVYIYSWNEELGAVITEFCRMYPEYKKLIKYVNLNMGSTSLDYTEQIYSLIDENGKKVPSLVCLDGDIVPKVLNTDYFVPLNKIGYKDKYYKNAFNYTKELATFDGKLKAVTWQATPGCFIYNRRIAKEVFGTDKPAEIQKLVKDWDSFYKAAKKLKKKGYRILCSPAELTYPMFGTISAPMMNGKKIKITKDINDYLTYTQKLNKAKVIGTDTMWSEGWMAEMEADTSKTFGYFGCTWFSYFVMNGQDGNYNMCAGPEAYTWGGSYIAATKNCANPALLTLILKTVAGDLNFMYSYAECYQEYPNNKVAAKLLKKEDPTECALIENQNHFDVWFQNAKNADGKNRVAYQSSLYFALSESIVMYMDGAGTPFKYKVVKQTYKKLVKRDVIPYL